MKGAYRDKIHEMNEKNRDIVLISDIEAVPLFLDLTTPHFKCLFLCDARQISADAIGKAMEKLLNQGMVYLCAWGLDCERVHDTVDEIASVKEIDQDVQGTIMTTSHENDSLEEAANFFLNCADCDEYFDSTFGAGVVIVVGNPQWQRQAEIFLAKSEL